MIQISNNTIKRTGDNVSGNYAIIGEVGVGTTLYPGKLNIGGGLTRDAGWHAALEIQPIAGQAFPAIFFNGQSTSQYSGFVWTASTSGNTAAQRTAQIYAQPITSTATDMIFSVNSNTGTTNPTEVMRLKGLTSNVGIGTTPAASAKLDISSTTGALLIPRMTTTQRDALTAVDGMLIYNTTNLVIEGRENGVWVNL